MAFEADKQLIASIVQMKKSLIALAFGTLVLGIAEFVMMGILTDVANDFNITIPQAGHLISAYAIGVCIGAPMLLAIRRMPLKRILLILAIVITFGNLMAAISPNYTTLFIARIISGLPHGAYFGVASIVAGLLSEKGKETQSVSIMIAGMTIANVIGVPMGTALSVWVSWRYTFLLAALWGMLTIYILYKWVPYLDAIADTGFRNQFKMFKHLGGWLILIATFCGSVAVFSISSYIRPILTINAGFSSEMLTPLMVVAGVAMVIGNLLSGRFSDKFTPGRVAIFAGFMIFVGAMLTHSFSYYAVIMVIAMILCYGGQFAIASPQQLLIIKYSYGAALMGGAGIQIAFNFGNALGAYLGGLPEHHNMPDPYSYSALIGAGFAILSVFCMVWFVNRYERNKLAK